jgi:hypothetical protein
MDDRIATWKHRVQDLLPAHIPGDLPQTRMVADCIQHVFSVEVQVEDHDLKIGSQQFGDQDRAHVAGAASH